MASRGDSRNKSRQGTSPPPARRTVSSVRKRRDLLADVAAALRNTRGDLAAMLSQVARACVPELCEMCIVDVVREDGTVDRVDAVHVDPSRSETMRAMLGRFTPRRDHPIRKVIASGRALLEPNVDDRGLARIARDAAHLVLLRRFGPRSSIRVPVNVDGRTAAIVTFIVTDPSRRLSSSELTLAQKVIQLVVAAYVPG